MMSEIIVPPRKRRRPALSCVECRRRKIKCDRRMPCSHCMQLKSTLCTYPETHSNFVNRRSVPKPLPNPLSVNPPLGNPGGNGPNPLPNLPSLAILPSLSHGCHSEIGSWDTTPVTTIDDSSSEKNVQRLVSRSRNPEELASSSGSFNTHTDDVMSVLGTEFSSFGDVMLQVGSHHPTRTFEPTHITGKSGIEDQKCDQIGESVEWEVPDPNKTQFFGRSHWMNTFHMFSRRFRYQDINGNFVTGIETDEFREVFEKWRRVSHALKAKLPTGMDTNLNFENQVPPREVADQLIDLYFRTYESVYRILHIPSFRKEYIDYWNDPEHASTNFIIRLLLVMAVGTCFYQGEGEEEIRNSARGWVFSAQTWTSGLFEKKLLNISILQIHCLLLLAREITAVGVHLIWIPSGNLIRIAFSMGLHRDPKHFPKLPVFVAEMRRRIWATVLEMTVQTSIDLGMPPLMTSNDFDTEPPSNINDEDISETTTAMPTPKPNHVFTQSSIQISLLKSLYTRLEIVQLVNSFHSEPSFDEVLRFGQEVSSACNEVHRLIQSYPAHLPRPTAFQTNLLDLYIRRFILEVHRPFHLRSQSDPRYYFSRKVCLENALAIFFPSGAQDLPKSHDLQHMDDYECLKTVGGGLFKTVFFHAITIITVELMLQLDEDIASGLPPSVQTKASREPLYQATKYVAKLATDRVRKGEDNIKGPVFFNAAAAVIQAKASGMPPGQSVPDAAKRSAYECLEIFKSRLSKITNASEAEDQTNGAFGVGSESSGHPEFGFDLMMPDSGMEFGAEDDYFGFQMQDSWLFTNWDAS